MTMQKCDRLMLTIDPQWSSIARDASGIGWRRFGGGIALTCRGCGVQTTTGYIDTFGDDRRCDSCVIVRDGQEASE